MARFINYFLPWYDALQSVIDAMTLPFETLPKGHNGSDTLHAPCIHAHGLYTSLHILILYQGYVMKRDTISDQLL